MEQLSHFQNDVLKKREEARKEYYSLVVIYFIAISIILSTTKIDLFDIFFAGLLMVALFFYFKFLRKSFRWEKENINSWMRHLEIKISEINQNIQKAEIFEIDVMSKNPTEKAIMANKEWLQNYLNLQNIKHLKEKLQNYQEDYDIQKLKLKWLSSLPSWSPFKKD